MSESEAQLFKEKYEVEITQSANLKEELGKVGSELSKQIEATRKDKEYIKVTNYTCRVLSISLKSIKHCVAYVNVKVNNNQVENIN